MYIKSLKLQNFRNYADESFAFDPAVNFILKISAVTINLKLILTKSLRLL